MRRSKEAWQIAGKEEEWNGTKHHTNQPPARSMGGREREREKDTGKGKEGSGVLKESVRPTAKLQGWRDEEKRRSLLPPPLPPSPSEPCHKESVLPAVVGENKRKRRREGEERRWIGAAVSTSCLSLFFCNSRGMWASGKRGCDFRELMMRHFWPKKGWRDEKVAECV